MPTPTRRQALTLVLLSSLLPAAACSGDSWHVHGGHHGPPVLGELEPNDSPLSPDFLGGVGPGTHFIVEGHVEAIGFDTLDHFELYADEPLGIEFYLSGTAPGADLDLSLWDPDSGLVVATYDSPWNPEEGFFSLDWSGKRVVLVVEAWALESGYSLEILGTPHPYHSNGGGQGLQAAEPGQAQGGGISFPDGLPYPDPDKNGPAAPDRETLAILAKGGLSAR